MPLPKHDNAVNSGLSFCASACCHSMAGQLLNEYWCCCLLGDNNWSSAAASVPQHSYQICLVVLVHLRVTVALSPRDQLVVILISLFFLFLSLALLSLLFLLPSTLPSCRGCCCVAVATKMEDVNVCTSSQYHFLLASQILHPSIVERNYISKFYVEYILSLHDSYFFHRGGKFRPDGASTLYRKSCKRKARALSFTPTNR